jgi:Cupin-like domain
MVSTETELTAVRAPVLQLINDHVVTVAAALLLDRRTHLANLVRKLPVNSLKLLAAARAVLPDANAASAAALAAASAAEEAVSDSPSRAQDAVTYADIAMIFGAPPATLLPLVALAETQLRGDGGLPAAFPVPKEMLRSAADANKPVAIEDASGLSIDRFRTDFFRVDRPVKIVGAVTSWSAVNRWRDPRELCRAIGHRTAPVEITDEAGGKMREEFATLKQVLEHMTSDSLSSRSSMYMAQHPLSTYMPVLNNDFEVPKWAAVSGDGLDHSVTVNFWIGTINTGTRLHHDSQDNFLVQVIGRKRVTLFDRDQTSCLHVSAAAKSNFSPVDVDQPDFTAHPQFVDAVGMTTLLEPGDALYIPAGVWHWVRACEPSVSINFWF